MKASLGKACVVAVALLMAVSFASDAQVPPHAPGTICQTPQFWCWARTPGRPGQPCSCPGPLGPVNGIYQ